MRIYSNKDVWKRLLKGFPEVALLTGPSGVGRSTVAAGIAEQLVPSRLVLKSLYMADADRLVTWLSASSAKRVCVVDARDSSPEAWNRMLSVFEDVPSNTSIWVIDRPSVPAAIRTRASKFAFHKMQDSEVAEAIKDSDLVEEGFSYEIAGPVRTVGRALEVKNALAKQSNVQAWLKAILDRSREGVLNAVAGWDADATALLIMELEARYRGEVYLEPSSHRFADDELISMLDMLTRNGPPQAVAATAGLAIVEAS